MEKKISNISARHDSLPLHCGRHRIYCTLSPNVPISSGNLKKDFRFQVRFLVILPNVFSGKSSLSSLLGQSMISFYSAWHKNYCLQAPSRNENVVRNSEKSSSTSLSVFSHNEGSSVFLLQISFFPRSQESTDRKDNSLEVAGVSLSLIFTFLLLHSLQQCHPFPHCSQNQD